ncbi:MAG: response regulator transcription factor [Methylococcaceae bacterium]|nr:response regulator transcription factor [Methylococcaceae bacterium]
MPAKNILIVEDNQDMAHLLALHLRDLQHSVELCFDGEAGFQYLKNHQYDLVILDLMLPGIDGLSICRTIRKNDKYTPILMITAKDSELDRVQGLETGADDYVTKPFSITEVLARIKAIFRRMDAIKPIHHDKIPDIIQRGVMLIDLNKHRVTISGLAIDLTAKEFDLLAFFARHPGRVFSRDELLNKVWGYGHDGYEHTVNSHINRLRVKIEDSPKQPFYIQTVWGVGYKFSEQ